MTGLVAQEAQLPSLAGLAEPVLPPGWAPGAWREKAGVGWHLQGGEARPCCWLQSHSPGKAGTSAHAKMRGGVRVEMGSEREKERVHASQVGLSGGFKCSEWAW